MLKQTGLPNFDFTSVKGKAESAFAYKDVDLTTAAGKNNPQRVELSGRFLYVAVEAFDDEFTISATKSVGVAVVSFNEKFSTPIELSAGRVYRVPEGFEVLYIRNAAQASSMMRLYSAVNSEVEPFKSSIEVIGGAGATLKDAADVAIAAGATTLVLAVNPSRQRFTISNLQANGTPVRVGASTAGAARGAEIGVGGSYTEETTDAVYVYNPSGAAINIGRIEVEG